MPASEDPGECKKCVSGNPENDDTEVPTSIADTPNDCQKPGCENGSPSQVKDDTDLPDPDTNPDNECKKCENKSIVADAGKNGSPCPDEGNPSCSIDKCQNGICNHTEVAAISSFGPPDSAPAGNLTAATSTALTCLQNAVAAAGGSMIVTTTYRSQAYQDHLVEVWGNVNKLNGWTETECDTVRANHVTERNQHFPMGAPARGVSNHTNGAAFDATVSLPAGANTNINTLASGCNLTRPVAGEPWHYER